MNVQKISFNIAPANNTSDNNRYTSRNLFSFAGIKLAAPLAHDTVSFGARMGRKKLQTLNDIAKEAARKKENELLENAGTVTVKELPAKQKIWKIRTQDSKKIHEEIQKAQEKVHTFMHDLFDDLVVTDANPKNPILTIKDRAKSEWSINEKATTRKWKTVREILENMTDLNGAKIEFRKKSGKADVEKVLDRFIPLIQTGQIELREIEIKRPLAIKSEPVSKQVKYDYAPMNMLKKLASLQEEKWNGKHITNGKHTTNGNRKKVNFDPRRAQYTPGNYCATHMLIYLPKAKRVFELQLMGAYVGTGKDLDDIIFKLLDGKEVAKKYSQIETYIDVLKKDSTGALDRFKQYRKDALFALRKKEIREEGAKKALGKNIPLFLSAKDYKLPPEYDLNHLLDIKNASDKRSEAAVKLIAEKNKEKAAQEKIVIIEKPAIDNSLQISKQKG